jgi:hypothetical protein
LIQELSSGGIKIVEISVGLGAAAIIIDKVLSWTLKWKQKENGTGLAKAAFERPEFVKHDLKVDKLCEAVTKLCNSDVIKSQILSDILSSSKRQEEILGGIREDFRNGGQR